MRCPFCSQIEDKVVDTRPSDGDQVVRRRREPFDRAKILSGLKKSCAKRPVPVESLDAVVDKIERELVEVSEKEIPSSRIGDAVMAELRDIDDVAYVRFASVYWPFRDLAELMSEIKNLVERRRR